MSASKYWLPHLDFDLSLDAAVLRQPPRSPQVAEAGQADAGCRSFTEHLPPEAEKFGGATPCARLIAARVFDEPGRFHEPSQVLLVESHSCQRFDHALQLEQGE